MLHYVHSNHIYNSQKLETTQVSLNKGMDTDNVYISVKEYYSAVKNNDFMKLTGKLIELGNIILSEVTQSQKNTHGMILAQKLGMPKIQFTDYMKLKKKEDKSVDVSLLL